METDLGNADIGTAGRSVRVSLGFVVLLVLLALDIIVDFRPSHIDHQNRQLFSFFVEQRHRCYESYIEDLFPLKLFDEKTGCSLHLPRYHMIPEGRYKMLHMLLLRSLKSALSIR